MRDDHLIKLILISIKIHNYIKQRFFVVSLFFFRTFDLIFVIFFFITKLILYYKIFKYVSEAQKISNLDKNVKRKKFKRVNIIFVYTLFTLGFFNKIGFLLYITDKYS